MKHFIATLLLCQQSKGSKEGVRSLDDQSLAQFGSFQTRLSILRVPFMLALEDWDFSRYTEEEAKANGRPDLVVPHPALAEFSEWKSRKGRNEIEEFAPGAAQRVAEDFCKDTRDRLGGRCSWREYQAVVTEALRPFSGSFNHAHLEGVASEAALQRELLPEVRRPRQG